MSWLQSEGWVAGGGEGTLDKGVTEARDMGRAGGQGRQKAEDTLAGIVMSTASYKHFL